MKFYRVLMVDEEGCSAGVRWSRTKKQAEADAAESNKASRVYGGEPVSPSIVFVRPTKEGILSALRAFASHPDNG